MTKKIIIVESPSKCKTIRGYLGKEYDVIASKGHICQLKSKSGSVIFDDKKKQFKFIWEMDEKKVNELIRDVKKSKAGEIYLASDKDREGEAIAAHVNDVLIENKIKAKVCRITFNEITKSAIENAINNSRQIDENLVCAYRARIGADYCVGFEISPLLYRIIRCFQNQSAGRVQSPTLKFIVERDLERKNFKKEKFFTITVNLENKKEKFATELFELNGKKFKDFSNIKDGEDFKKNCAKKFILSSIEEKDINVNPDAPFITSTIQQEAFNYLNLGVAVTMKLLQEMYEGMTIDNKQIALITYMRTDSTHVSKEGLEMCRNFIKKNYKDFLSEKVNVFDKKIQNAQNAHECIRPVNVLLTPDDIKGKVNESNYELYKLIWNRFVASQMKNAIRRQISLKFYDENKNIGLKTVSSYIKELGFMILDNKKDKEIKFESKEKDVFNVIDIKINEHETMPPAAFTEATIIKKMQEYGIGRPSTYAGIIETLKKRDYVDQKGKQIQSTFKGQILVYFLRNNFSKYIDYKFTADMESFLDDIADGKQDFQKVLKGFIDELEVYVNKTKTKKISEIFDELTKDFPQKKCVECDIPMSLRMKFTFFYACDKCNKIEKIEGEKRIIEDCEIIKNDRFTLLQSKDRKVYLPTGFKEEITKDQANFLFTLPKEMDKIDDEVVIAGISKYGFYLKYKDKYKTIKTVKELMSIQQETIRKIFKSKV